MVEVKQKRGQRKAKVSLLEEDRQAAVREYVETDLSTGQIARKYGISAATLYNYLNQAGVPRREDVERQVADVNGAEAIPTVTDARLQESYERPLILDEWANAVPTAESEGHLWHVTYTLCQKETLLGVGSIEEAIASVRERAGQEIDIIKVVRA